MSLAFRKAQMIFGFFRHNWIGSRATGKFDLMIRGSFARRVESTELRIDLKSCGCSTADCLQ